MKKKNKYTKKQKFSSFFLKIFVPIILVAGLLGGVAAYLLVSLFNTNIDNAETTLSENMTSGVENSISAYRMAQAVADVYGADYEFQTADNQFIQNLEFVCGMRGSAMCSSVLGSESVSGVYERQADGTLARIAGQERRMFIVINDKDGNSYKLSCSLDDFRTMTKDAPIDSMSERIYSADLPMVSKIDEIYVNGGNFWISKYSYFDFEDISDGDGSTDGSDRVDMVSVTVSDIPDGYVKLDTINGTQEKWLGPVGTSANDVDSCQDTDKIEELIAEIGYSDEAAGSAVVENRDCDYGRHYTEVVKSSDDYYIVIDYHYSFAKSVYSKAIIAICIGIIILSGIVSFAIAYAMYKSYKAAWDMEQYRRTTSNAMAHDLKSPLAVIQINAENLRDGTNPEKNSQYMDNIIDEVEQMNSQIASILDMARAEDVNTRLNKTDVDIAAIVNSVAEEYAERVKEKNVSIEINGACTVHADETLMNQAIKNVMDNAVKYVTDGGHIAVNLSDKEVSCVNSSEPLDKDALADVWKPFVKGDNSRHGHKGTGLGLSIVRTIMDRHGFDCEMRNVDDGVEVRLIFR